MILREIIDRLEGCATGNMECDKELAKEAADALSMLGATYCETRERNRALRETVRQTAWERDLARSGIQNKDERRIMCRALAVHGMLAQVLKLNEEFGEFLAEVNRNMLGAENREHVAEELADVIIMCEQMEIGFGLEDEVAKWRQIKLERLWENVKLKNE